MYEALTGIALAFTLPKAKVSAAAVAEREERADTSAPRPRVVASTWMEPTEPEDAGMRRSSGLMCRTRSRRLA
jgi:hypothetical protein